MKGESLNISKVVFQIWYLGELELLTELEIEFTLSRETDKKLIYPLALRLIRTNNNKIPNIDA